VTSGYLKKRGTRGLRNWKERFFVLCAAAGGEPAMLTYYERDGDTRARGAVRVERGCCATVGGTDGPHAVVLALNDGPPLRTRARDRKEAQRWADALNSVAAVSS
jgi:hypothetical protein